MTRVKWDNSPAPPEWVEVMVQNLHSGFMNIYSCILGEREDNYCADVQVTDLYGRQNPVSPFSTSSLNCWTQSRKATMAWSNLLSQKNLRPPEQYRGSSWTNTRRKRAGVKPIGENPNENHTGLEMNANATFDLSVSDSKYEWFPYGTRRYLGRGLLFEMNFILTCRIRSMKKSDYWHVCKSVHDTFRQLQ